MPTYRGITLILHSQFDILPLPEYSLPPASPLIDGDPDAPHILSPSLPGSHFWISYAIAPPVPKSQFFLFKMRIDGKKVVSWCAGGEEGHEGKIVCGLFEGRDGVGVERRAFRFAINDAGRGEGGRIEIDVHRASGRRRVARFVEKWDETENASGGGIELVPAGRAGPELPKRFYEFALIDAVDRPFAQFRFYYRSWEQLEDMGVLYTDANGQVGEENSLPVIEPSWSDAGKDVEDEKVAEEEKEARCITPSMNPKNSAGINIYDELPESPAPLGTLLDHQAPADHLIDNISMPSSARNSHRLSIPPKITLNPTNSDTRALPAIPRKSDSRSSTAYRPHPAYPVEEWRLQTPSPVQSVRDGLRTPPLRKKGFFETLKGWGKNFSGTSAREGKDDGGREERFH